MVRINSNIPEVADEYFDDLFKQMEDATYRTLVRTGLVGEKRVKGIIEKEAYDTGRLLRSVTSIIYRNPDLLRLVIGTNLEYAVTLEYGRKPGKWPNLDELTKWVGRMLRREGINTRVNISFDQLKELARTNGKKATKQQQAYREHLSVLYLVGRKIATKGIREKYIFKRIEDGLLSYFQKELDLEYSKLRL